MYFTEAQNPNLVQTALDSVFYEEFEYDASDPGIATALTGELFKVINTTHAVYNWEVNKPVGLWTQTGETQTVPNQVPFIFDKVATSIVDWTSSIAISKNLFDDNLFDNWAEQVKEFARAANYTRDTNAFALFNGMFTTTLTADGVAAISASHVLGNGATDSNLLSSSPLSDTTLNNGIVLLRQQKNQAGTVVGGVPRYLVVPPALWKHATQLCESVLQPDTATNNMNVYSQKYSFRIYQSPYLSATAGGSDTAWFLMTPNHSVRRLVRQGVETALTPWQFSTNRTYNYQGNFRESYFIMTWAGLTGATGV